MESPIRLGMGTGSRPSSCLFPARVPEQPGEMGVLLRSGGWGSQEEDSHGKATEDF